MMQHKKGKFTKKFCILVIKSRRPKCHGFGDTEYWNQNSSNLFKHFKISGKGNSDNTSDF